MAVERYCGIRRKMISQENPAGAGAVLSIGTSVINVANPFTSFEQRRAAVFLPVLVGTAHGPALLPEDFRMMGQGQNPEKLQLLETYLERVDPAEQAHLHRSSACFSLGHIQRSPGWHLGDGSVRFHRPAVVQDPEAGRGRMNEGTTR